MDAKAKIEEMKREVIRRGGRIGGLENLPDPVAIQFLESILQCPDCQPQSVEDALFGSGKRSHDH